MDIVAILGVVTIFGVIPVSIILGIYHIVKSVQKRRIVEAYLRQGLVVPPEDKTPRRVSNVVLVRALAFVGVAIGLALGEIWYNNVLSLALVIGFAGLGMLVGWLIVRPRGEK